MGSFIISGTSGAGFQEYVKYVSWANYYRRVPRDPQPTSDISNGYNPPSPESSGETQLPESLGPFERPETAVQFSDILPLSPTKPSSMEGLSGLESGAIGDAIATSFSQNNFSALDSVSTSDGAGPWRGLIFKTPSGPAASISRTIYLSATHLVYSYSSWSYENFMGGIFFGRPEYVDYYDLWVWRYRITQRIEIKSWSCSQGEPTLSPVAEEVGERCPLPPPPPMSGGSSSSGGSGGGGGGSGGGSGYRIVKKREEKEMGCCSCAAIADMLAQQNEQIKMLFETQNTAIGETLTEQTKFLQEQMVALTPKGFDYKPIFDAITDAKNDTWNGLQ